MAEPQTVNAGLIVPNTGDLVGTWGSIATNPDYVALDGYIAGVQAISVSNVPVTLTKPLNTDGGVYNPTPGGGPTQAQNRVLRFTGVMTGDVRVTLPLPGVYVIENFTTGNFVLSFQGVTATEVIGFPQGERHQIYNDSANVRFTDLPGLGAMAMWAGISVMPAWVGQCTVKPFLLCDGTVYNYSDFPYLGPRLAGQFGGNGATTFGVPDMRGRVPLAYDGTGGRITVGGCGINGQTIGAALDRQTNTLGTSNLPPYTPAGSVSSSVNYGGGLQNGFAFLQPGNNVGVGGSATGGQGIALNTNLLVNSTFAGTAQGGTSVPVNNVQPSIVTGIWVIKT